MSSSIWTACAGASRLRPLRLSPWRAVEAQHLVSTRKLVDSVEEQAVLEELIEASKPPQRAADHQHVLLSTPFRYPPLAHGSRFGGRFEPGLWYGSEDQRALFAEVAYYRLLFLEGTAADLGTVTTWHTAFTVRLSTGRGVDLVESPFAAHRDAIASPTSYMRSQALGRAMREDGVEAFRYPSARDRQGGVNIGVFTPSVFGAARPRRLQTWHATSTRAAVELVRHDYTGAATFIFRRDEFVVDGRLPSPAI